VLFRSEASREQLIADLKQVIASAELFVSASASQSAERIAQARERMEATLRDVRGKLEDAQDAVVERARAAAESTENSIRDNPWTAVGIAGGIGILLGLLIGRKWSRANLPWPPSGARHADRWRACGGSTSGRHARGHGRQPG